MSPTEQELVNGFIKHIKTEYSPWGKVQINTEFNYIRGRTDIIVISEKVEVIAIEAKLVKWRSALQQAYRNSCFADKSYILLPQKAAYNAAKHENEFNKRGVGICFFSDEKMVIIKEAKKNEPLQPWLREKAINYVKEEVWCNEQIERNCKKNM